MDLDIKKQVVKMKKLLFLLFVLVLLFVYFLGRSFYLLVSGHFDQTASGIGVVLLFLLFSATVFLADIAKEIFQKLRGL